MDLLILLLLFLGVVALVVIPLIRSSSRRRTAVDSGAIALQDKTSTLAIVAFVGAFVAPVVGVVCGHIALSQIKRTSERGWGLSVAALVISYIAIVIGV